jgi:protein tyrosine/serine phosphatase
MGWVFAAALVALGAWAWFGWARPNFVARNFGVVDEGKVYRSAALTSAAVQRVHDQYGVKTIVDLGGFDKDTVGERVEERTAAALGMERFVFPLEGDGTGNPNAYVAALRVMNDPVRQPVLVHCSSGAQRTGGAVMLYRDLVQGKSLDESYAEARAYRHDPARNPRLLPFLKDHEAEIRAALRDGGEVKGYPKP